MLPTREAFYGGAGGGGKSFAMLMAALQYVDVPGYAALILRRTYKDLAKPKAIMDVANSWLAKTDAKWNDNEHTWRFPSGATLTFGYLEAEKDKYQYQGGSYQFIGWDELTQFYESQYRFLFGWLRKPEGMDVPLRVRAASNPGGVGHDWVKQRFLIEHNRERVFLSAKLADNPYLNADEYRQSLAEMDSVTRRQILDGDWSARQSGGKFQREWFEVVDAAPAEARYVRYWDMAATEAKADADPDWTAGSLMGRTKQGLYYIKDMRRIRATPARVEELIKQAAKLDGEKTRIYMEQEPGASGVHVISYYRKTLAGYTFYGERPTGDKETRANPLSSQAEGGNVKLVRGPWVTAFLDEAEAFPSGSHDDQVDAASGAFAILTKAWMSGGFGYGEKESIASEVR